jgi:calcium/calmodulin-dependent protein kinase I
MKTHRTAEDTAPRGVTFVSGCYVELLPPNKNFKEKNASFYGFEITPEPGTNREKRIIYAKSEDECKKWVDALKKASDKVSIEEFYVVGPQLGKGRFSRVCEATHKQTNVKHACKIIDKVKLIAQEKELLRTEIAILKLVRHPNIIRLHVCHVMSLVSLVGCKGLLGLLLTC